MKMYMQNGHKASDLCNMLLFLAIGVSYVCSRISAFFILGHSHPWIHKYVISKEFWRKMIWNWLLFIHRWFFTVAEFKSFVMNNTAFGNLFCNSQKSFHTSPGSSDSTMVFAFTKNPRVKFFVNAIVEFEVWSIASIIRVLRSRGGVKTLLWITE